MKRLKKGFNYLINCFLYTQEEFEKKTGVEIDDNCRIYSKNFGADPHLIEIGNHSHVTMEVHFVKHDRGTRVFRQEIPDFDVFGKIKIGDNTYLGIDSLISPGVTIGKNCVIGTKSVVTKSIPDNSVIACPARYISSA